MLFKQIMIYLHHAIYKITKMMRHGGFFYDKENNHNIMLSEKRQLLIVFI